MYHHSRWEGSTTMRTPVGPVDLLHLFPGLHAELMSLLRSLRPGDWRLATACALWSVKDIVAHLLDTCLRRLSFGQDGPRCAPDRTISSHADLVDYLNHLNRVGSGRAALSPGSWWISWTLQGPSSMPISSRSIPMDPRSSASPGPARRPPPTGSISAGSTPSAGCTSSRYADRGGRGVDRQKLASPRSGYLRPGTTPSATRKSTLPPGPASKSRSAARPAEPGLWPGRRSLGSLCRDGEGRPPE